MHTHTKSASVDSLPLRTSLRRTLFVEVFCLMAFLIFLFTGVACLLSSNVLRVRQWNLLESTLSRQADALQADIALQREKVSLLASDPILSAMPSVTTLVGFTSLLSREESGEIRTLAGQTLSADITLLIQKAATTRGFSPIMTRHGFLYYLLIVDRPDGLSSIIAVFDARTLLSAHLDTTHIGGSSRMAVVIPHGGRLTRITRFIDAGLLSETIDERSVSAEYLASITSDLRGRIMLKDAGGALSFLVYQPLLSLGWTITLEIPRYEVYAPFYPLARNLIAAGLGLVGFLSLLMFSFSRRISAPLEELFFKLNNIESKHWQFQRSVHTGDEVEAVDIAAADLTQRLRSSHQNLASLVRSRTSELISNHERNDVILQSIEYGVLVTDSKGRIILMNSAAEAITGWDYESVNRRSFSRVLRLLDEKQAPVPLSHNPMTYVLRHCKKYTAHGEDLFSLLRKDERTMPLSLRVTPVVHNGRKCIGAVAVFRDVTEERRIEHLKSDFISLASHQLRTPLSAIRWHLELLGSAQSGTLNDKQEESLQEAFASTVRMVKLVDALLNASRIELGNYSLAIRRIRPVSLVRQVVQSFGIQIEEKRIRIIHRTLSAKHLHTDPLFLQLIIENLLSNAIKYSRIAGTIVLEVRASGTHHIAISIADEGIGIPVVQHKQVFQKLFRADNVKQSDTDGNGLGLYISQVSAEVLGGTLSFESAEGKGSVFTLMLPVKPISPRRKEK